eukprot:COSAG04_NODE_4848_length_1864_cov_1.840227_1_plen_219_part_10
MRCCRQIHVSILPQHPKFATLLRNLSFVVVDEAHMYRGVFGCHVSAVFRRLQRLCAFYGGDPQYIGCSATVANGEEHFGRLVPMAADTADTQAAGGAAAAGTTAAAGTGPAAGAGAGAGAARRAGAAPIVISHDGSPSGKKQFGIWNPPELEEELQTSWAPSQQPGAAVHRVSSYSEAAWVLAELVRHGRKIVPFLDRSDDTCGGGNANNGQCLDGGPN